jgi:hypothetical protein
VEVSPLIIISQASLLIEHKHWDNLNLPNNMDLFEVRITIYTIEGQHVDMVSELCNKQTVKNRLNYIPLKLKAQLVS